jgi:predicted nucleic acid-binding Zn ribbon protein
VTGRSTYSKAAARQANSVGLTDDAGQRFNEGEPRQFSMPTYTYEIIPKKKGQRPRQFEVVQKMRDAPLKKDPKTGETCKRVITGGCGVVFHGPSIMSMNVPRSKK